MASATTSPPPEQPGAYKWHPDDLRIPIGELKQRYDPQVWTAFELWTRRTLVQPGTTVWNWLNGQQPAQTHQERQRIARTTQRHMDKRHQTTAEDASTLPLAVSRGGTSVLVSNIETRPAFETGIASLKHEEGAAWNADGKLIASRHGEKSLTWSISEIAKMEGGSLSHNHPSGLPPSKADYQFAIKAGLAEMRIVTKDGVWIVSPPQGGWPGKTMVEREAWWRKIEPELAPAMRDKDKDSRSHHLVILARQVTGADVRLE